MAEPQERWECPNCGTPLNIAALGIYAKVACPACGHVDRVHTMLANFRIEGILGLGGMSVVLRARDLVLDRPLAIKLLNEFYRDHPERMARFEQECELMAKVRHENVVSVYSAGRVKGRFYIAMELVNGHNLEELVREQGPLPPLRALEVLRDVVQGLRAASKAGLLHRDMKPGNILICEDGRAKVLDFGLSLGKREADTEDIIWATPYYVPPETLQRQAEDTRTDIYALGMTLRHLLTGQQNFDPAPEGIEEMLACKRSLPRMAEVMPSLPEPYCELIDHMTAYAPADRPDSYASLLVEIAEVRSSLLAERRGVPIRERFRRCLPLLLGAVVTLSLGSGAAAMCSWLATPEPEYLFASVEKLHWPERDTLEAAMADMQAGNTHAAATRMAELADSEGEPTACAWASLHASMLLYLQEADSEQVTHYLRGRFSHHLSRIPTAAGLQLHEQMSALGMSASAPENKFLQAALAFQSVLPAQSALREPELKLRLQSIRSALRGAGTPYGPMVEQFAQAEATLAASLPDRAQAYAAQALGRLDVAEAFRAFSLAESAVADGVAARRLAVQKEALALFADAVEMMQRHSLLPPAGELIRPEALKDRLSPLQNPTLAAELTCLMHVALGEFEQAAACNPYAIIPDSSEPFAVMLRDWLSRAEEDSAI